MAMHMTFSGRLLMPGFGRTAGHFSPRWLTSIAPWQFSYFRVA
jgi:hypothetical protein